MELLQPSSLDALELAGGQCAACGRDGASCRCSRDGLVEADVLVDVLELLPRGIDGCGSRIGAGTTLAELERASGIPEALREAARLAASPQLRSDGHGRRKPAPVDALLVLAAEASVPCRRVATAGRPLPRGRRRASRARDLRERLLRLGPPVRHRGGAARARRDAPDEPPRAAGGATSTACRRRTTGGRRRSSRAS